MKKGKFYGIGVGVGDPENITVKATKKLHEVDVIVLPEAKSGEGSTAFNIVREYLKPGVEQMFLEFPMIKMWKREKFLEKISVKKENPKKRIAPPVPVESKYRNGAVMVFQYEDGMYGALIAVDGAFFDTETYYAYLQTDIKMTRKPTMEDVRSARILDPSFHSAEYNSFRDSKYYYSFVNCISGYLKSTATKKFEKYNDSVFEIIGYLSDWGSCCSAASGGFDYYKQKSSDEFKISVVKELNKRFDEKLNIRTELIIDEIDKEFILSNTRKGVE